MRTFPLILSILPAFGAKDGKPVAFSYTAIARAYFDEHGFQRGIKSGSEGGAIGMIPDRFPRAGDKVVTDGDRYTISTTLGEGTGSAVYRASSKSLGRDVAIKFQSFEDSERVYSVETEFEVLRRTAGFRELFPQVYYLSGSGLLSTGDGVFNLRYLVMELLGSSLWTLMKRSGYRLPLKTVATVGIQALEILKKLHSLGIIHGDIHLENILFKYDHSEDIDGNTFSDKIVFGDYGKANMYRDPSSGQLKPVEFMPLRSGKNMLFLSPFELAGSSYSRREDIFRLVESLARMVDERRYQEFMKTYQTDKDGLRNAKQSLSLSDVIPGIHPVLSELYSHARSMGFDDEPHYDEMQRKLKDMLGSTGFAYDGKILRD